MPSSLLRGGAVGTGDLANLETLPARHGDRKEKGGHFRIRPAQGAYTTQQLYLPDTAVLITRFLSEAGVGEVVDFMPPAGERPRGTTTWFGWCAVSAGK